MEELILEAQRREITGKKVRFLRRKGLIPAKMYGPDTASVPLQVDAHALIKILTDGGRNALIKLKIEGDPQEHMAMVREIQKNPVTDVLLHADLYKISMTHLIRAEVPIVLDGDSEAVSIRNATLVQHLTHLTVECMPGDLPREILVDISILKEFDDMIRVRDISLSGRLTLLSEPEEVIVMAQASRGEVETKEAPEAVEEQKEAEST